MFRNVLVVLLGTILSMSIAAAEPKIEENLPTPVEPSYRLLPSFINCTDVDNLDTIVGNYSEIPFSIGEGTILIPAPPGRFEGQIRTYVNPDAGSFTIVLMLDETVGCILVMGRNFGPWVGENTL